MTSQVELEVAAALQQKGLEVDDSVESRRMPVHDWPWKTPRSRTSPTADLFLPAPKLYIEIKGLMTIHAMAKMAWLANAGIHYYLLQNTEHDWDPWTDALDGARPTPPGHGVGKLRENLSRQASELAHVSAHPELAAQCGVVTRARLRRYIETRAAEFRAWNGAWP